MRYQISNTDLLRQMLSELHDDPSLPWHTYPCLEWPRSRLRARYGVVTTEQTRPVYAHRLAYKITTGELGTLEVCHHCDNPPCFRPSHLFLGTRRDNVRDCLAKGRVKNGQTKLTKEDVQEIRSLYAQGLFSVVDIGERFGVTPGRVSILGGGTRRAKLGEDDVRHILSLRSQGWTYKAIGERFGVTLQNIHYITSGKYWKQFQPHSERPE